MKDDKRKDYISKDEMYMLIARIAAKRSKDPNTQVGAVIVSDEDRILSVGYNGFPNGCSDDEFPWVRKAEEEEDTKYPYVCHSELNAILNFRGDNKAFQNATIYVTLFPCHECAKIIIQSGIKRVIFLSNKYVDTADFREAARMFDAAGVKCYQYHVRTMEAITMINNISKIMNKYEINDGEANTFDLWYNDIIEAIR